MNPDGFEHEYNQTTHTEGIGRANANHVDLNRNFPNVELEHVSAQSDILIPKQTTTNGESRLNKLTNTKHDLEPEVRAAMHWSLIYPFVLSGNLHGGALVANYPYDTRLDGDVGKESK